MHAPTHNRRVRVCLVGCVGIGKSALRRARSGRVPDIKSTGGEGEPTRQFNYMFHKLRGRFLNSQCSGDVGIAEIVQPLFRKGVLCFILVIRLGAWLGGWDGVSKITANGSK